MVHVLFAEGLTKPGRLAEFTDGIDEVRELASVFSPDTVAPICGVDPATIVRLARELSAAETAAVYARIGTCTQEFGTIASWLVDLLNLLTGNLDREGGAVFPLAAAGQQNSTGAPGKGRGTTFGRWHSRVRGQGEVFGELPVVCLAEEIETPGEGQIRALITLSGNPALSAPNAERLDRALEELDFMLSVDVYLNETTRHADVILPAPSPLRRPHYDIGLYQFAVHNAANYSPPVLEPEPELPDEWLTLLRLAGVVTGQGPDADVHAIDDFVAGELVKREIGNVGSGIEDSTVSDVLGQLAPRRGPQRLLDLMLRVGAYGDKFGKRPDGLSLALLEANPHGIDLGPTSSRLPDALRTRSGQIELAPPDIVVDMDRLRTKLTESPTQDGLVLVGRRDLRSNNSWMHNLPLLVKGSDRCTMHVHPDDAQRLGLADGKVALVTSKAGGLEVPVEVTDAIMPGVVSIPHGWGHDRAGVRLGVAGAHAGVNSNILTDDVLTDALTGNAVFNGIPVTVVPA
jgi:anaerobic selenocysteine-containing dehydrogenase